jgi:hypothetical protein
VWIWWGHSIYNKDVSQNTLSACTDNDRSSNTSLVGLKFSKPQISQQHPSKISFITPGWHVTRDLNLLLTHNQPRFCNLNNLSNHSQFSPKLWVLSPSMTAFITFSFPITSQLSTYIPINTIPNSVYLIQRHGSTGFS